MPSKLCRGFSHIVPDFFLICFLSPLLSSEYRRSFCLSSSTKDTVQETLPGPTSAPYPSAGGHASSLEVIATGSRQLCRLTSQKN